MRSTESHLSLFIILSSCSTLFHTDHDYDPKECNISYLLKDVYFLNVTFSTNTVMSDEVERCFCPGLNWPSRCFQKQSKKSFIG